ncbi:zinc finger protein 438 isoform X1 [Sorex fumeus]|uniref:zinc finger protein 438 isoform X1 n=1 Tax=Sorex fumeus TaxID=62283 RepID=UPI0024AD5B25|nr:zinc finger protein 438 isoform X1 [Sorex fumeus]
MQNSLSVPARDQGDVPKLRSPIEKQPTQKMSESPQKTICTGEPNIPSGAIQSGKGLQNKSQFRNIAPKIVPKVLPPRMLPCHSPSLSDRGNPGPSVTSKSLGMPAQNYALMQVAGHEGTFSLVALSQIPSAQPIQKPRMPPPENLKLPIPRYQPPRNNRGPSKKPVLSSSESSKQRPQIQASPSPVDQLEPPHKPGPTEQVPVVFQAPVGISATRRGSLGDPQSPVSSERGAPNSSVTPMSSIPRELTAKQGLRKTPRKATSVSKMAPSKPDVAASEKLKGQIDLAKAMTVLSPAILGNTVQLIPSIPKGKLPILPYSRVKTADTHRSELDGHRTDLSLAGLRADCGKTSSLPAATNAADKMTTPPISRQNLCGTAFGPATKPDLHHKTKLNGGPTKRRGRKRKVPEDILAFQGKRRKCLISKCRESKEKVKSGPQESRDHKSEAMKKYRSIMPKPVLVMPALAPLASPAALLPPPIPGSPGQDAQVRHPLPPKHLPGKQDGSPAPKRSASFRNGFSWHRCHVCNHHFQFKQHLRDHMSTHTNRRLYRCRICLKAYVRSGNLSTHMKLHHSENRLKKLVCCEFCAKVFGHVRVYFGHLKEVHRVVISTEPSPSEPQPGDPPRNRDATVRWPEGSGERENKSSLEDLLLNQADEVKLQIRCGRCQITAQSFADIKFHLLYAHGEEIQGRLQEAILPGSRGAPAPEELVKSAAPHWKHPERRKQGKPTPSEEEPHTFPKLNRQPSLQPQNDSKDMPGEEARAQSGSREPQGDHQDLDFPSPRAQEPRSSFNCILCPQTWGQKEELLLHWGQQHNCENPLKLWTILSALSTQGVMELAKEIEK